VRWRVGASGADGSGRAGGTQAPQYSYFRTLVPIRGSSPLLYVLYRTASPPPASVRRLRPDAAPAAVLAAAVPPALCHQLRAPSMLRGLHVTAINTSWSENAGHLGGRLRSDRR
jgi:hypothetical protein